ncbi:hypothetical protein [Streptomyces sparsus]
MSKGSEGFSFAEELLSIIEILGANSERQINYCRLLGVGIDELALEFDDIYRTAAALERVGSIPEGVVAQLSAIDGFFEGMTVSETNVWTEDAVKHSPIWEEVRSAARLAEVAVRRLLSAMNP